MHACAQTGLIERQQKIRLLARRPILGAFGKQTAASCLRAFTSDQDDISQSSLLYVH